MTVSLSPLARMQFNQGGIPLAGGLLFTYAAGTTTKLATYTDSTGVTPNANPIVLDANGQCDIWLTDNLGYKFVLSPSTDTDPPTNAYWTKDNISNVPSATPAFTSITVGTINKVTITQPATAATLTIANNKTLTVSNTLTFTGTDASSVAFGTGGTVVYTGSATTSGLTESTATMLGRTTAGTGAIEEITIGAGLTLLAGSLTCSVFNTLPRSARTSNTILAAADKATLIDITSGTFSQTFTAAATLGAGWYCWIRNSGTGDITLDPNGAEQIDGLTTFVMYGQEARLVICDGVGFYSVVAHPFYRKATSTFTFVMPPGYLEIEVDLVGGGGQGGSGRRGAAGTDRAGGSPGGAPARVVRKLRNITAGSSTTVTIGAGGTTGGGVQTVNDTDGIDGQAGGNATFGTLVTAYGGAAGKGGAALRGATSGSGSLGAGTSTNANGALNGGKPFNSSQRGSTTAGYSDNFGEGGGGVTSQAGATGGCSEYGGASSGAVDITATTVSAINGSSMFGVGSASSGGWITSANTLPATALNAGANGSYSNGGGAAGGTCGAAPTVGTNGTAGATDDVCGSSGGGGGSTITGGQTGKAGGNGAAPGGAGGGGGAVLNGQNSGAGGNGANGQAIIKGVV